MTFALFDCQEQALESEAKHRREHPDETRLAIVLPTGTGKAYTLCARAVRYLDSFEGAGNRVLVIVHTDELVSQLEASARFVAEQWPSSSGGTFTVGVVKADRDDVDADIIIGSRQTLEDPARRARIHDVGLVIVDECHIGYTAYLPIMEHFGCMDDREIRPEIGDKWAAMVPNPHPRANCGPLKFDLPPGRSCPTCGTSWAPATPALGFTATLSRSDGAGLGRVWQDVAYTRDISWAIRRGYLKQPIGYRLEIGLDGSEMAGSEHFTTGNATALDMQIADSIAPERAVEKWLELAKDRPTILFAPLVRSARAFADAFTRAGISAAVVHGAMPDAERRQVIADFKAGKITVVCNAMVLTAGFDHPAVSCVMVMRPTKSETLFVQMAGRGLRRIPGIPVEDQDCILISLADGVSDLRCHVDLSDRPLDPKSEGPLTVMEDAWDIGKDLEEAARHWTGKVDATRFDPIAARRSKVWTKTQGGTWFVPISAEREYVFLHERPEGTSIYVLTRPTSTVQQALDRERRAVAIDCVHRDVPDLELAMTLAEDVAADLGGDVGALLADRTRPWRNQKPKPGDKILAKAHHLGLTGEVMRIMSASTGGKAGKISDLIRRVEASRSIDKAVERIKEREQA